MTRASFVRTVCLVRHLDPLPARAARWRSWTGCWSAPATPLVLGYVRLNMIATVPAPMSLKVVLLPGDGIGPEILAPAVEVLDAVGAELQYEEHVFGGASIDAHGTALTDETLAACRAADAVLLAAVGGPKWDTTDPDAASSRAGAPRAAQGTGAVRQPPARYARSGALRRQPAAARA